MVANPPASFIKDRILGDTGSISHFLTYFIFRLAAGGFLRYDFCQRFSRLIIGWLFFVFHIDLPDC